MATEDDEAETLLASIEADLIQGLEDEVHGLIEDVIQITIRWIEMGSPPPPSHPSLSRLHPSTRLQEIPNEALVLAYGEAAAMYGDATRRTIDYTGHRKMAAVGHRSILADVAKLFEQEVSRRLEKA